MSQLLHLQTIDTTQNYVEELLKRGKEPPFAVIADQLTEGRGRCGRKWIADKIGNLYLSIALNNINEKYLSIFPISLAISVSKSLGIYDIKEHTIKWPNDLLINNKKVGGILIEKTGEKLIIGVGVNVYHVPEVPDIAATSIKNEKLEEQSGLIMSRSIPEQMEDLANRIFYRINQDSSAFDNEYNLEEKHSVIIQNWMNKSWKEIDEEVVIKIGNANRAKGLFKGLEKNGSLMLEVQEGSEGGEIKLFSYGDVTV